ncbi:hypothetical protein H8D64_01300 [PVC group bacterium]|nr:hypothetical protein [PVC group bacterium]
MKTVTALCILLIFQYVHGSIRLFFPHFLSKLLIEIALLSLIFSVFMRGYKLRLPPGLGWLMAYVFLVFISGAYNGNSLYSSYRFCRFPMYSYLCFFAAWNAKLNIRAMRQIMLCLLLLWSLQIIMAVLQIASIGQAER